MKNDGPKIRIKECMEDWEERELGDITESYSGGTPSVGNKSLYGGTIPFIRSGEINSEITELFLTKDGLKNSSAKMVEKGNILYALYGATSGEVSLSKIEGAINQAILCIKPTLGHDSYFIYQWLLKNKKNILKSFLQGGQGNLSGSIVKKFILSLPIDKKEQKKIGSFFKDLDNTIALHQQELDSLKQTKQGFLQKMFPKNGETKPEFRFKEFTGKWNEEVLGNIADFSKGNGYSKGDLITEGTPILLYGQLYTNYKSIISSVSSFVSKKEKSIISTGNEVVVPASGESSEDIARASAITIPGVIIGGDLNIIRPINKIEPIFLALVLSNGKVQRELSKFAQGKSVVHLQNSEIKKVRLTFPKIEEQVKIGEFFKQLDEVIDLKEQELEALRQTKKGFLQKMFI